LLWETKQWFFIMILKANGNPWSDVINGEALPRKVKVSKSTQKIMATIFWDCEGILLIELNTTVNEWDILHASLLNRTQQRNQENKKIKKSNSEKTKKFNI
jgi:hypothetical protein